MAREGESFRSLVKRPLFSDHEAVGAMTVIVIVIVPMIVAALVNENDTLIVIVPHGHQKSINIATTRSSSSNPRA